MESLQCVEEKAGNTLEIYFYTYLQLRITKHNNFIINKPDETIQRFCLLKQSYMKAGMFVPFDLDKYVARLSQAS